MRTVKSSASTLTWRRLSLRNWAWNWFCSRVDWASNETELNSKNVDCLWNGLSITPARLEKLTMTKSYMKNRLVIITKSDSGINSLSDMAGKVLGTQGGNDAATTALDNNAEFKGQLKQYC